MDSDTVAGETAGSPPADTTNAPNAAMQEERAGKRRRIADATIERTRLEDELISLDEYDTLEMRGRIAELEKDRDEQKRQLGEQDQLLEQFQDALQSLRAEVKAMRQTSAAQLESKSEVTTEGRKINVEGEISSDLDEFTDTSELQRLQAEDGRLEKVGSEHLQGCLREVDVNCNDKGKRFQAQIEIISRPQSRQREVRTQVRRSRRQPAASHQQVDTSETAPTAPTQHAVQEDWWSATPMKAMPIAQGGQNTGSSTLTPPQNYSLLEPASAPFSTQSIIDANAFLAALDARVVLTQGFAPRNKGGRMVRCKTSFLPPKIKVSVAAQLMQARAHFPDESWAKRVNHFHAADQDFPRPSPRKFTCERCCKARIACLAAQGNGAIAVLQVSTFPKLQTAVPGTDGFYIIDGPAEDGKAGL